MEDNNQERPDSDLDNNGELKGGTKVVNRRKLKKKAKEIAEQKKPSTSKFNVHQSKRGGFQGSAVSKENLRKTENTISDKNNPPKPIETISKVVGSTVKKSTNESSFVQGCSYSSVVMSLSKSEKPAKITSVSQEQLSPSNSNDNDLEANKSASSGLGEDGINQSNEHLDNLQAGAEEGIDNVVEARFFFLKLRNTFWN
ncbi:unnamed protein product [Meloidogyne enterolobii]|uniref:Uncharacterized protein n=1 Tax=Meloidogyne enterolobii TaxID=390850 RepID=A0ACB1AVJ8_MELEN